MVRHVSRRCGVEDLYEVARFVSLVPLSAAKLLLREARDCHAPALQHWQCGRIRPAQWTSITSSPPPSGGQSCHPSLGIDRSGDRTANLMQPCLNQTNMVWVGISETIELEHFMAGHRCCHSGHRLLQRFKYCHRKWPPGRAFRNTAICKQNLYAEHPFRASCSALGANATSLEFRWKTDMYHRVKDNDVRNVVLRMAAERPTMVILGGGVAHFTKYSDYPRGLNSLVPTDFDVPQHWIDDYLNATSLLFELFGPARRNNLPSNV